MLAARPHLAIHRPSPTTVAFTVSTASPRQTLTSRTLHYILLFLRVLLGLSTLLVLHISTFDVPIRVIKPLSDYIADVPFSHIAALSFVSLFVVFRRFYTGRSSTADVASDLCSVAVAASRKISETFADRYLVQQKNPS